MKKAAILLWVILFCNSCSLFRAKIVPYPSGVIFPVVKDQEFSYEGEIISRIQKKDHFLYFSTRNGKVYCFDGQKKEMLWHFDISETLVCPPYLTESRIYICDDQNFLYCLGQDGKLRWKKELENKITSGIAEGAGHVYAGTEKGKLYSLSPESGQEIWQYQAGEAISSNLIIWRDMILFGCDDHSLYFVGSKGQLSGKYDIGGRTGETLTLDENLLFFGTEDRYLQCLNLNRQKTKWKVRSGGATFIPPVVAENRVLFLCWNSVLYCMNKKNGTILWWKSAPSRSYYRVEVIDKKVVVSSFSAELVCFDIQTGESKGTFDASQEIKSNPTWLAPFLVVNLYDPESDTGKLVFLKKEVKAILSSSKKSPQKQNEEITFTVKNTGFHLPKYEFFLTHYISAKFYPGIFLLFGKGNREIVQESSELPTWDWFPEEEGYYIVEVEVKDERENVQTKLPFLIQKEHVELSLFSLLESPQRVAQEIVFTANFSGLASPRFEFRLSRLRWAHIPSMFSVLFAESEAIVQETSEKNSWTWTPDNEGLFLVRVIAQDGQKTAKAHKIFEITKK